EGPDVLVYFNQNSSLPADGADLLLAWMEGGNRLIYGDWTHDATVLDVMEAEWTGRSNSTSGELEEALSEGVTNPMPITNTTWGTFSNGLWPTGGASSLCTFEETGDSCVVHGNGGRPAAVGLLSDTISREADRQGLV